MSVSVAGADLLSACVAGVTASAAAAALPARRRAVPVGVFSAGMAIGGFAAGIAVLVTGRAWSARFPSLLPLAGVELSLDPLGAVFVVATCAVAFAAAIYGIGYAERASLGRTVQSVLPLFVLSLILVPVAASVTTFLVLWEAMAFTSLVLVAAEHRHRAEARDAAAWYGVMTQLGLVVILLGLTLFAGHAGGESFAVLRAHAARLSPLVRSAVFLLTFVGFASKAGVVPLHVWLPRAHPEAPSHVSALMSGAMVKLGVYGVIRVGFDLLGGGPRWWGLVILAAGAASALFGILHAMVSSDLKRLLAYSTTENVGLILVGVGAGAVFAAGGNRTLATIAMAAALLHVVNHAVIKGLLFLGAGSVLTATGTRDLDRLGGLVRRMPVTGATFAVGALAIAALPPFNGFVSEWLLLQSLVHSVGSSSATLAVTMPLAVAAVALTGGLAAATFVKAFGTGFLALPRSPQAEAASETAPTMQAALIVLAAGCVALGVAPTLLGHPLARAIGVLTPIRDGNPFRHDGVTLALTGVRGSMSPLLLAAGLVGGGVILLAGLRAWGSRGARRTAENWGCGRSVQTARMEYTATSFAEPLQRVFDDVLRPDHDVDVSHRAESRYMVEAIAYRSAVHDSVEAHLYAPVLRAVGVWGRVGRRLQNGSVHRYLAYAFVALVVILVVAR